MIILILSCWQNEYEVKFSDCSDIGSNFLHIKIRVDTQQTTYTWSRIALNENMIIIIPHGIT